MRQSEAYLTRAGAERILGRPDAAGLPVVVLRGIYECETGDVLAAVFDPAGDVTAVRPSDDQAAAACRAYQEVRAVRDAGSTNPAVFAIGFAVGSAVVFLVLLASVLASAAP